MTKAGVVHSLETIDRVIGMWRAGQSASQIATEFGFVSRNVVIGMVHRYQRATGQVLRVSPRAVEPAPAKQMPAKPALVTPPPKPPTKPSRKERPMLQAVESVSPLLPPPVDPSDQRVRRDPIPFLDRSIFECAWIVDGKDHRGLALCCGRRTSWGSYCAEHRVRSLKNEFTSEPVTRAPTPAGMRFVWGA